MHARKHHCSWRFGLQKRREGTKAIRHGAVSCLNAKTVFLGHMSRTTDGDTTTLPKAIKSRFKMVRANVVKVPVSGNKRVSHTTTYGCRRNCPKNGFATTYMSKPLGAASFSRRSSSALLSLQSPSSAHDGSVLRSIATSNPSFSNDLERACQNCQCIFDRALCERIEHSAAKSATARTWFCFPHHSSQ